LDISKIETGNFELGPIEYKTPSLINDVVHLNIVRIGSKPISFNLHIDPTIPSVFFGDETRVRQILNNLLSNAFKYTQEGHVSLRIMWKKINEKANLTFIVSDTGMGIRKADIGKLFSKYIQLDTKANRHIEGTGLGLSITKKLLQMMGGTISVESIYHKGSTFTVKLQQIIVNEIPIGHDIASDLEALRFIEDRNSDRGRKIMRSHMPYGKILVVDDVMTNLDVARGLLLPYGLQVDCAGSGREAIDMIREEKTLYDIVLMDHMMPEMDGIAATRFIRREIGTEYARTVPIVALTANAVAGNEKMFLANDFSAFISKPIDIIRLDTILNQWVRDKQSEETLKLANSEKTQKGEDDSRAIRVLLDLNPAGIDFRMGIQRYGSADSYIQVLTSFVKHTPALLSEMDAVSAATIHNYAILIHGIKGSSYGICADAIGHKASALEAAAKRGDIETLRKANPDFIEAVQKLLSNLELVVEATTPVREKIVLPFPDSAMLEKLLSAAQSYDTMTMEHTIAELERYEYESGAGLVAWLRKQMDNLEYESIGDRLKTHDGAEGTEQILRGENLSSFTL
jgi:CheY-like chemotaxis protein